MNQKKTDEKDLFAVENFEFDAFCFCLENETNFSSLEKVD